MANQEIILENESVEFLINKLKSKQRELIKSKIIREPKLPPISKDEIPFEIPLTWKWVRLSDVSIIQEGPGIRKYQYTKSGMRFLTVTNITEDGINLDKSVKYVSTEEYESKYKHFKINKGDIVCSCSGASWGKSALFYEDTEMMLNTSTLRLRFFGDLGDNNYLYYLTKTKFFKNQIEDQLSGMQPNFGYAHYSKILIPIPPLPIQKKIVEVLDSAFEKIAKAKENSEANLNNAKEVFENYLHKLFENKGDDWEEKLIGELCDLKTGGTPSKNKKEYFENGSINWLVSGDVNKKEILDCDGKITELGLNNSNARILPINSIMIALNGQGKTRGTVAMLRIKATCNQSLVSIYPKNINKLYPEYLFYNLESRYIEIRKMTEALSKVFISKSPLFLIIGVSLFLVIVAIIGIVFLISSDSGVQSDPIDQISIASSPEEQEIDPKSTSDCENIQEVIPKINCITDIAVANKDLGTRALILDVKKSNNFMSLHGLRDKCVVDVSIQKADPTPCPTLGSVSHVTRCYSEIGLQNPLFCEKIENEQHRANCFLTVVENDRSVCESIADSKPGVCCSYLCDENCKELGSSEATSEGGSIQETCSCTCKNGQEIIVA